MTLGVPPNSVILGFFIFKSLRSPEGGPVGTDKISAVFLQRYGAYHSQVTELSIRAAEAKHILFLLSWGCYNVLSEFSNADLHVLRD